jgi:general secretion pathway protein D
VKGHISIIGPENGHVDVTGEQLYAAFLASLDANGLAVYEHGRFLKIVEKQRAKQGPIPIPLDPDETYPLNEQMVTRMFKVKYAELEAVRAVLQQLVSPGGDTIPFPPDTLIVNDLGSNLHRLEKILARLDTKAPSDEVRVIQVQFAPAQDVADKVSKLFEAKGPKPGNNGLSQLFADERTNKLIAVASPAAMERIDTLLREIDVPIAGGGRVNVAYLQHANAEDVAATLQGLTQGTTNRPKTPVIPAGAGASKGAAQSAELFQGEVKISADKSTNSLVVVASRADFRSLQEVLEKLDIARRQVFVDAVIMEVNLDRTSELGINLHGGVALNSSQGAIPLVVGTKYTTGSGLPPSTSIANLANFGGFLAGLQGPAIPALKKLGIDIPSFGVLLDAMQTSSDVNVLSTPHILTTDNEEAEITVGQNVPFQSGFSSSSLSGLSGLLNGTTGTSASSLSSLTGLAGSTVPYGQIQRTNVDLKLNIKPQINDSDYVRLAIQVQNDEIASQDAVLGPTTSKRQAKTTVVAKDQETVVIGGIMQDRRIEGTSKVPLLGDIPILGHLFRRDNSHKVKVNLLIFLTPYIIRDASDFRRIFERKMKERQQFVEQFYGAATSYDVAIDFDRKPGPLGRLSQLVNAETRKVENGGPGEENEKTIEPH